ncbi:hypothetical protein ACO1DC_16485 [Bacillus velezensis]
MNFKQRNKKAHSAKWTSSGVLIIDWNLIISKRLIENNGGFINGKINYSVIQRTGRTPERLSQVGGSITLISMAVLFSVFRQWTHTENGRGAAQKLI